VHNCKNPQSYAVCERMHQTVGNVLRTLLHGNPPQNIANAEQYLEEALSIAMHAMRAGVHTTLGSSPGNLVFNRDMFLNIPLIANWHVVTVGTLKDGYVRNVPLPRVPREQRASPKLTAHKDRIRLPGYSLFPGWIPTLPKLGSALGFSQKLL
jgi:hypothetical protein